MMERLNRFGVHSNRTSVVTQLNIIYECFLILLRYWCSIGKQDTEELLSPVVLSRSSGLRICTATGSTAGMKSAGGTVMPLFSTKLQYMAREPNSPHPKYTNFMKGFLENDHALQIDWRSRRGIIYIDGSHQSYPINFGCKINVSNRAPPLRIFWGQK